MQRTDVDWAHHQSEARETLPPSWASGDANAEGLFYVHQTTPGVGRLHQKERHSTSHSFPLRRLAHSRDTSDEGNFVL